MLTFFIAKLCFCPKKKKKQKRRFCSYWLKEVTWLLLTNQSVLFQWCYYAIPKFICDIGHRQKELEKWLSYKIFVLKSCKTFVIVFKLCKVLKVVEYFLAFYNVFRRWGDFWCSPCKLFWLCWDACDRWEAKQNLEQHLAKFRDCFFLNKLV